MTVAWRRSSVAALLLCPLVGLVAADAAAGPSDSLALEPNGIDLGLVVGSTSARDDTLTPVAFTGPTLGLQPTYQRRFGRALVEGFGRAEFGWLHNRFGHEAFQLHYELGAAYLRRLERLGSQDGLAIGAVARAVTDLSYLASWDDAHGYWLAAIAVGPAARGTVRLGAQMQLEWRGDVTLVALASRPPERRLNKQDALTHVSYFVDRVATNPGFATPATLQQGRLEIGLRRTGADRSGRWSLRGELRFSRHSQPQPYLALYAGMQVARRWGW